ncbi:MAG: hypothetical protein ACK5WR_08445 [Planctomycetaceae bacterium]
MSQLAAMDSQALPLAVLVGFGGSRNFFPTLDLPQESLAKIDQSIESHLQSILEALPRQLGLSSKQFLLCGVSSLASGADQMFSRCCQQLGWRQEVLLPQGWTEFLAAKNSTGQPDFSPAQAEAAEQLFQSPHVLERRVASTALGRHERFEDVNLEISRQADVVICLRREGHSGRRGGTDHLWQESQARERPCLMIGVSVSPEGQVTFTEEWFHREQFQPPSLPAELRGLGTVATGPVSLPAYCTALKKFASGQSRWKQTIFRWCAVAIIGTHVGATVLALLAIKIHAENIVPWLLCVELLLLSAGFLAHSYLHSSRAAPTWAMSRLVAEIARSVLSLKEVPGRLTHLFSLPLPETVQPLLKTLNVLHLAEVQTRSTSHWTETRDTYVHGRIEDSRSGQLPYYSRSTRRAEGWLHLAHRAFFVASLLAFAATLLKLILVSISADSNDPAHLSKSATAAIEVAGFLAVVLPLLAVAALSLAASVDLEAQVKTYRKMVHDLQVQKQLLTNAASERAFVSQALETERQLVGETLAWYWRRSFTSVT